MTEKILVIEDEPVCRKLLTSRLSDAGFQVFAPEYEKLNVSFSSIIETLEENGIRFVVADLMLPDSDGNLSPSNGVKLIAQIKRQLRRIAIYILTGSVNDEVFAPLKKLGVRGSYIKDDPQSISKIIEEIKRRSAA